MGKPVIRAEHLSVRYEGEGVAVDALKDVSFEVEQGEFIVVLGPSGSGKSTLLNIIGGMDQPTSGAMWYGNQNVTDKTLDQLALYRRDVVGFVFQFFNLIPSLTARENVELAASLVKSAMKADEALAMVGLEERAGHFPSQLSGGEQQRTALARAIVNNPPILICDEPTGNLDPDTAWGIMQLLDDINKRGTTIVMATHAKDIVDAMQKRVVTLKRGHIIRDIEKGGYDDEA